MFQSCLQQIVIHHILTLCPIFLSRFNVKYLFFSRVFPESMRLEKRNQWMTCINQLHGENVMWPFTVIFILFLFLIVKKRSKIEWHATLLLKGILVDGSFHGVWITVYMQNWLELLIQTCSQLYNFAGLHLFFIRMCSQCINKTGRLQSVTLTKTGIRFICCQM